MPYISQEHRLVCAQEINEIANMASTGMGVKRAGFLNYCISKILKESYPAPNYAAFNEMIGILECAKQELYRAQVAPYEQIKAAENGEI